MLEFLVDNIFVVFGGKVFQQIVGIPMGTKLCPSPSRHISVLIRSGIHTVFAFNWKEKMSISVQLHIQIHRWRIVNQPPWGPGGVKSRMCPPYPQRDRKRRLNGAMCRNHRIKRVVPCRCRTGTLKNPAKCLWRWEPDRRYNFFFNPPAHLCRHIYMYNWNIVDVT